MKDNEQMHWVKDFLVLNGFEKRQIPDSFNKSNECFAKDKTVLRILKENYVVKFFDNKESYTWYSEDLTFYSLLGFLIWHNFISQDFKRQESH